MKDRRNGWRWWYILTTRGGKQQPLRCYADRTGSLISRAAAHWTRVYKRALWLHSIHRPRPSANITRLVKTFTTNKERFREKKTLYYLLMTLRCPLGRGRLSKFINLQVSGHLFFRTLWPTINHGWEFYLASEIKHTL